MQFTRAHPASLTGRILLKSDICLIIQELLIRQIQRFQIRQFGIFFTQITGKRYQEVTHELEGTNVTQNGTRTKAATIHRLVLGQESSECE